MTQKEIAAANELMRVLREFKRDMRRPTHTHGMKPGEMAVMRTVAHHQIETGKGIRVSEIGKILKIANPTVTQFINVLEKTGWVTRKMDNNDRRSVLVYLTEEGKSRHQWFEDTMTEMFQSLTQHIGLVDTEHLIRIMPKAFSYMETYMQKCHQEKYGTDSGLDSADHNEQASNDSSILNKQSKANPYSEPEKKKSNKDNHSDKKKSSK